MSSAWVSIGTFLEESGIFWHGDSSWYLLIETTPADSLLPKYCHINLINTWKSSRSQLKKNPPTCTRNNNLNFLCYLAKWLVCLVGRVGGPQALSCAFSRWCPGHRLRKCQAGPGQQQTEVLDGSAAGGSSLVCEGLGVKSFHSVTLSKP